MKEADGFSGLVKSPQLFFHHIDVQSAQIDNQDLMAPVAERALQNKTISLYISVNIQASEWRRL